jgi:chromosome segregation ATPase
MPSLLKSIALAAGTGIVLGVYATAARFPRRTPENSGGPDPSLLEPLLDRLERVEAEFLKPEAKATATAQEAELRTLRTKVDEAERRAATALGSVEARFRELRQAIPSLIEASLNAQMTELRSKVEAHVELRVAERAGALERAMADQLTSIGGLSDRAVESDANLQRLIAVVERLCERPPQPSSTVLPFEAQLAEAAQRELPAESRVRVIKENEPDRRHRFPLGRTFAVLLALFLPRLYR